MKRTNFKANNSNNSTSDSKDDEKKEAFKKELGKLTPFLKGCLEIYTPVEDYLEFLKNQVENQESGSDKNVNQKELESKKHNLLSSINKFFDGIDSLQIIEKFHSDFASETKIFVDKFKNSQYWNSNDEHASALFNSLIQEYSLPVISQDFLNVRFNESARENECSHESARQTAKICNGYGKIQLPDTIKSQDSTQEFKSFNKIIEEIKRLNNVTFNNDDYELLINNFRKVKSEIEKLDEKFSCKSKQIDSIAEYISNWSRDVKSKLKNENVFEAIAMINMANWIASQGHQLRDVQILCILLYAMKKDDKGRMCQVETGEGKTTIIAALAAIKVLEGNQVDIITSSPILAQDAIENKSLFYQLLNISVDTNNFDKAYTKGARICYSADVVYGSIANYQFDFLRHQFFKLETRGKREFKCVIVDEVDNMIIDNAGHIAKISQPIPGMDNLRYVYINIWTLLQKILKKRILKLKQDLSKIPEGPEKPRQQAELEANFLNDISREKLRKEIEAAQPHKLDIIPPFLRDYAHKSEQRWIENALRAQFDFELNKNYVIKAAAEEESQISQIHMEVFDKRRKSLEKESDQNESKSSEIDNRIVPVDFENTGVSLENTIWSHGLHQFLQLKHNLRLTPESLTCCYISNLGYIKKYGASNIYGISGTLGSKSEQDLLLTSYGLDFVILPTFIPKKCKEIDGIVAKDSVFFKAITVTIVEQAFIARRAVLAVCETIHDAQEIHKELKILKKKHNLKIRVKLYDSEKQSQITHEKIRVGDVIIATNLAGRGTDLKTNKKLDRNGGLHVLVCFLPYNKRVEDQAFGRTARQGRRGTAQLVVRASELKLLGMDENAIRTTPDVFKKIKRRRDSFEKKRIDKIKRTKVPELEFQDEIFELFCDFYAKLSEQPRIKRFLIKNVSEMVRTSFNEPIAMVDLSESDCILNDLKDLWAFWLNDLIASEKEFTKEIVNQEFENFKSQVLKAGLLSQSNKKQDNLDVQLCKVVFNPYYAIQQADCLLEHRLCDQAAELVEAALKMNQGYKSFYSAHMKQFEIDMENGSQLMERFYKALNNLVWMSYEIKDGYKSDSIKSLSKVKEAILQEKSFIESNILDQKGINKEFELILRRCDGENLLLKQIISRLKYFELYLAHIDGLANQLKGLELKNEGSNDWTPDSDANRVGYAIHARIPSHFKSVEGIKKCIQDDIFMEFSIVGMDVVYGIRKVYDVHSDVIKYARYQILFGFGCMGLGFLFPVALPILSKLAITFITEGIMDLALDLLCRGIQDFDKKAYLRNKVLSYSISLVTLGIDVISKSTYLLNKAINACRSLAEMLRKCKYMKWLCRRLAQLLEYLAKYLEYLKHLAELSKLNSVKQIEYLDKVKNSGDLELFTKLQSQLGLIEIAGHCNELSRLQKFRQVFVTVAKTVAVNTVRNVGMHLLIEEILNPILSETLADIEPVIRRKILKELNDHQGLNHELRLVSKNAIDEALKKVLKSDRKLIAELAEGIVKSLIKQSNNWKIKLTIKLLETFEFVQKISKSIKTIAHNLSCKLKDCKDRIPNERSDEEVEKLRENLADRLSHVLFQKIVSFSSKSLLDIYAVYQAYQENQKEIVREKERKEEQNQLQEKHWQDLKAKQKELDSLYQENALPGGDKFDVANASFKYRRHIVIINEKGETLVEYGSEYAGETLRIVYQKSESSGELGHYGDNASDHNNCLFDELGAKLGVDAMQLRSELEIMRTQARLEHLGPLLVKMGIIDEELIDHLDGLRDDMLAGGHQDPKRFIKYSEKRMSEANSADQELEKVAQISIKGNEISVILKDDGDSKTNSLEEAFKPLKKFHDLSIVREAGKNASLVVEATLGGQKVKFKVKASPYPNNKRQIYITTDNKDFNNTKECGTYAEIAKRLDWTRRYDLDQSENNKLIQKRAELILDSIRQPQDQQINWKESKITLLDKNRNEIQVPVFDEDQIRAAAELIIFTQVAEAAPPSEEFFRQMMDEGSISKPDGRAPIADKIARTCLEKIARENANFSEVFLGADALFIPARKGGCNLMRTFTINVNKGTPLSEKDDRVLEICENISSSTETENKPELDTLPHEYAISDEFQAKRRPESAISGSGNLEQPSENIGFFAKLMEIDYDGIYQDEELLSLLLQHYLDSLNLSDKDDSSSLD